MLKHFFMPNDLKILVNPVIIAEVKEEFRRRNKFKKFSIQKLIDDIAKYLDENKSLKTKSN